MKEKMKIRMKEGRQMDDVCCEQLHRCCWLRGGRRSPTLRVTKEISRKHSALRRSAEWRTNMFVIFRTNTGSPTTQPGR